MEGNFTKQLRDAALLDPRWQFRKGLRIMADRIAAACDALGENPSIENLQMLNGHWAHAVHMLKRAQIVPDPSPTMGAGEVQLERKAA